MGGVAGIAMTNGKSVFQIDPEHGFATLFSTVTLILGTIWTLSGKKRKLSTAELLKSPVMIDALSSLKSVLIETFSRYGQQMLRNKVLNFDSKDLLRLAWDMHDWRDVRTAQTLRSLPSLIPDVWQPGEVAQVFRGGAHGTSLHHYLKTPNETLAKKILYPHWELLSALETESDKPDILQITPEGVRTFSKPA